MLPNVREGICQEMSDVLSLLSRSIGFSSTPALIPTASFVRDFQSSSAATVVIILSRFSSSLVFPSPSFCFPLRSLLPPAGYMSQHIIIGKKETWLDRHGRLKRIRGHSWSIILILVFKKLFIKLKLLPKELGSQLYKVLILILTLKGTSMVEYFTSKWTAIIPITLNIQLI